MSLYYLQGVVFISTILRGGKYGNFHFFIYVFLTIASYVEINNQPFLTVLLPDLQSFLH